MTVCSSREMRLVLLYLLSILLGVIVGSIEFPEKWHLWKTEHGKHYPSLEEEGERHRVWLSNRDYIERHNTNADHHGYSLALNHFGDLVW